ncbi:LysM peptidoglycan-binding domain-containing protein [Oceanimonas sp. CHS3-5]|uniref:LysM peptidoglycan-binding domain-containing protein n=1 Tax=Oceanimonas sp. CHS3-5 TaxID=3068186 RepID=UPI00273DF6E2|nr:LysM peptidoglycan-binding domain-containing protein [Oceanimonas sp. CHS3-5]MDP5293569.1 LysM peptidoglycan-binding domain-containing protein [Oceanimonas sp. CHS3-5]
MIKPRALILAGMLLLSGTVQAQALALKDNHPTSYTVRKGDTLWDISAQFLKSPWRWPRLWRANPQVANPHLIYPGDRLTLVWVNGEPRLVRQGEEQAGVVKLSPRVRAEAAVATVPLAAIMNYTRGHRLLASAELDAAPVLLGDRHGRDLLRKGELAYVEGRLVPGQLYGVYRDMGELTDERTHASYGRRAVLTGAVSARAQPEPSLASVHISSLSREMRPGDVLLPLASERALAAFYQPAPGPGLNDGRVLAMGHQGAVAARHDVVLLNRGHDDGLHAGHLYGVYRPASPLAEEGITLPSLPVARVMVFQTYDHASAALVLDSREPVQSHYQLGEPEYDEHGL